jgi:hypothetical protein
MAACEEYFLADLSIHPTIMTFFDTLQVAAWSKSTIAGALLACLALYLLVVAIHRLYFSQYAKFPGPKLAALTYGYMFYYDVVAGDGQYMYKIMHLHEEYSESLQPVSFLKFGRTY